MGITIDLTNEEGRELVKLRGCTRYTIIDTIIDMVEEELPPLIEWEKESAFWRGTCEDDDDKLAYVFHTQGGKFMAVSYQGGDSWYEHGSWGDLDSAQQSVEERFS